jgi:hypothetical protein
MQRITMFVLIVMAAMPLMAENTATGTFKVAGKSYPITHAYAFAKKGFFDETKDDVVVLLCDADVPAAGVRDMFERRDLVKAGKLHCVQQTIDANKQVINFRVEDSSFSMAPSGGSTNQVFEAKTFDGKTIAGRALTKSAHKSFEDIEYTYDITFSAAIEPKK